VTSPVAVSSRYICPNSLPPVSRVKRKNFPSFGSQSAAPIGSAKKVSWRRSPPGIRTSWIWAVLPKRVLMSISARVGCQPTNVALRASV
jgi:hypothetical protein